MELYEWELSFGPVSERQCESAEEAEMHTFTADELERLTICRQKVAAGFYRNDA